MAVEQVSIAAMTVGGKLSLDDLQKRYLREAMRHWPDGPVLLTAKRQRPNKTDLQLGYYFAVVVKMIAEDTGNDPDIVHQELKKLHLEAKAYDWIDKPRGEKEPRMALPSVSDLNTVEMSEYTDRCRLWAAETLNLEIPEPDPRWARKAAAQRAKVLA